MPQSSYLRPVMLDNSNPPPGVVRLDHASPDTKRAVLTHRPTRPLAQPSSIAGHPTRCRPAERSPIAHHPAMRHPTTLRPPIISTPLPMPLGEMPPIPLMHPTVGHPSLMRMRVLPVTANPFVPTAVPAPIPAQPDVSRGGRGPVFLYAGWGRGNRDNCAYVIPLRGRGSDHASTEYYRQHGNCYQLACAKMGIRHMHSRRIEGGRSEWPQWRS